MDLPQQAVEQPAAAVAPGEDSRSHLREDGTLVIDILIDPPCGESSEREIVVCASDGSENRLNASDPPPQKEPLKAELQLSEIAKAVLRGETDPRTGAQRAMVDLKIKF